MSDFIQHSKRSIQLPLGCKDLIDVQEVRNWKPTIHRDWPSVKTDQLAYMEGYLTGLLQSAGNAPVVFISRCENCGRIAVIRDYDLAVPALFAAWKTEAQEQAVRGVFEDAGISPIYEPVGRWKAKRSMIYALPKDVSIAARLIGEVLRVGYGLEDLAYVSLWYHEAKAA